jgi:hypothetical protein
VSKRGERYAADYVAVALRGLPEVRKSAGTRDLLLEVVTPLCDLIARYERTLERATDPGRGDLGLVRDVQKTLKAIEDRGSAGPLPLAPFNRSEWRTARIQEAPGGEEN